MANNIYPDLTQDTYDIPYSRRKILASDLFIRGLAFVNGRLIETGDSLNEEPPGEIEENPPPIPGTGDPICCGILPPDDLELDSEEGLLEELGVNVDHVIIGLNEAFITRFKNYGVKLYRNYVEQFFGQDYLWHYKTGLIQFIITPEATERFAFQGLINPLDMYQTTEYDAMESADNINSFQIGNNTIILSTFIGARVRLFRNEVLQSFVKDYKWTSETGKLELVIAPVETEHFKVIPY